VWLPRTQGLRIIRVRSGNVHDCASRADRDQSSRGKSLATVPIPSDCRPQDGRTESEHPLPCPRPVEPSYGILRGSPGRSAVCWSGIDVAERQGTAVHKARQIGWTEVVNECLWRLRQQSSFAIGPATTQVEMGSLLFVIPRVWELTFRLNSHATYCQS
jgi:hypothetical protein